MSTSRFLDGIRPSSHARTDMKAGKGCYSKCEDKQDVYTLK